ncbi:MAG: hypothetical protein BM555_06235 [Crocinitomix sp. MedPE-SWsnd]|jgi:hypothetical protein|nr:MAG: hypothetical protein BM555_06235 [Crocinitomix sp. MedPE-SWsnd]
MKRNLIIAIVAILSLSSCDKGTTSPCIETKSASAIVTEFPETIKAGTIQTVEIKYILESDCGEFDHFEISQDGPAFNVEIVTKYQGCTCDLQLKERSAFFDVDVDFPGTYKFNFWLSDGDYDSRTVTVFE